MANQRRNGLHAAGMALALLALAPTFASAQTTDPRLLPWLGCWEPANGAEAGDLLCVRPASQSAAVEVVRLAGNEIVSREVVWADGARHETQRADCSGWEEGTFSKDGRRLFLHSEHSCDSGTEAGGGIMAIASPTEWLDIRVAGQDDDVMAWVQRYQVAPSEKTEAAGFGDVLDQSWNARTARMVAAAPMDVDDVIEANEQMPHQAVEALLAERGDQLDLSAAELTRMADAGVPGSTIDVAVAVSYPETFQVAGDAPQRVAAESDEYDGRWGRRGYGFYDPYFYDPFYRYGYGYGYSPFGYGFGGYYGGYGYIPTVVVVDRQSTGSQHGRVVNGRGYTRGGGSAGPSRTYIPSRSSQPAARRSSGSGSGAATRSTGSGSRGSSSGRTAKPRGGRGGR